MISEVFIDMDGTLGERLYGRLLSDHIEYLYGKTKRKIRPVIRKHNISQTPLNKVKKLSAKYGTRIFPGAKEFLCKLSNDGYGLSIITYASKATTYGFLEKNCIKDLFKTKITSNDVKELKPDPEGLYLALKRSGAKKESSVLIGDRLDLDGYMAKMVGMKFIPATRDFIKLYGTIKAL